MKISDVKELHYITPIQNVPSILKYGILSHNLSKIIPHDSLAMQEIQELRKNKVIPNAGKLHDYANLYFDAHNPMLSKRRKHNNEICILCINPEVLNKPGVIIADKNAASSYVRFYPVSEGLESLDKEKIFSKFWINQDDQIAELRLKSTKCAEVLVPAKVEAVYITGAYVANQDALKAFEKLNVRLTVSVKSDIFF